jgi:hypothetical protein
VGKIGKKRHGSAELFVCSCSRSPGARLARRRIYTTFTYIFRLGSALGRSYRIRRGTQLTGNTRRAKRMGYNKSIHHYCVYPPYMPKFVSCWVHSISLVPKILTMHQIG